MPNEFDLIVVGAGPAGASCALYAARAGLRVLLLDRARFPRDKVCGDFVPRRAQRCLEELGLLHRLLAAPHVRLSHLRLVAPSGAAVTLPFCPAQAKPPGYAAYVCRRWHLDALLVEAAREVAAVREGFAVTHVLRDGQAVVGVRGHGEGTPEESFAARLVVGADGHRSVLRRQLGLYRLEPRHWAAAARAYYRGVDMDPSTAEVHFLPWVRSGYLWLFPADDGLTNVGLGVRQHELRRQGRGLRQALAP